METTDFVLLVTNSRNGMKMLSPEGGKIWLTTTLEKRSQSRIHSQLLVCLKQEPEVNRSSLYHGYKCTGIHLQDIRLK